MARKMTIRQLSDGQIFVAIQPAMIQEELEKIQTDVLKYIQIIGQGALAGKCGQRKGVSYFRITAPCPWTGLKEAVELGLAKSLAE